MRKSEGLAYIDTNILLTFVGYNETDKDYQKFIDKMLYKYTIKIPQIVLGEALAVILDSPTYMGKIHEFLEKAESISDKIRFDSDRFPPINNTVITRAQDLIGRSDVVKDMDLLILSHALVDNDATHFLTADKALRNPRILDYIKNLKKDGVRDKILNIPMMFTTSQD